MKKKYSPISCDFYDKIELLALRKSTCKVIFRNANDEEEMIEGVINNVFAKNKKEFLDMGGDIKIRLDRLVSINGMPLPDAC